MMSDIDGQPTRIGELDIHSHTLGKTSCYVVKSHFFGVGQVFGQRTDDAAAPFCHREECRERSIRKCDVAFIVLKRQIHLAIKYIHRALIAFAAKTNIKDMSNSTLSAI